MSGKCFFGGVPTDAEVDLLLNGYLASSLIPGFKIPYDDVSKVISQSTKTSRFRTVTSAWRKRIENDYNIVLSCDKENKSFVVLSEGGKVKMSRGKLRSAASAARRSFMVSGMVKLSLLTPEERKDHDFNVMKSSNIIATAQLRSNKNILPEI